MGRAKVRTAKQANDAYHKRRRCQLWDEQASQLRLQMLVRSILVCQSWDEQASQPRLQMLVRSILVTVQKTQDRSEVQTGRTRRSLPQGP